MADQLSVTWRGGGDYELQGELDLATAPLVVQMVERFSTDGEDWVVFDLTRLMFIDCAGVRALVSFADGHPGRMVVLRAPSGLVAKVLDILCLPALPRVRIEPPPKRVTGDGPGA